MTQTVYGITVLLITTISGSLGAILLKKAMSDISELSVKNVLTNKWVYLGLGSYILSAVFNIVLLKLLDYSIAYPMTSLTYVWTVFISYLVFKEKISLKKIIAVILIVSGVFLVSQ